jgi:hypothetical protein
MTNDPEEIILFACPHCGHMVGVQKKEVNCKIFRHGVMRHNGEQINPHLPKEECDRLASEGLIRGCGKPFRLIEQPSGTFAIEECEYI